MDLRPHNCTAKIRESGSLAYPRGNCRHSFGCGLGGHRCIYNHKAVMDMRKKEKEDQSKNAALDDPASFLDPDLKAIINIVERYQGINDPASVGFQSTLALVYDRLKKTQENIRISTAANSAGSMEDEEENNCQIIQFDAAYSFNAEIFNVYLNGVLVRNPALDGVIVLNLKKGDVVQSASIEKQETGNGDSYGRT